MVSSSVRVAIADGVLVAPRSRAEGDDGVQVRRLCHRQHAIEVRLRGRVERVGRRLGVRARVRDLDVVRAGRGEVGEVRLREVAVAEAVRRTAGVATLEDVGAAQDAGRPEPEGVARTVGGGGGRCDGKQESQEDMHCVRS